MTGSQSPSSVARRPKASLLTPIGRGAVATIRVVCDFGAWNGTGADCNDLRSIDSLFRAVNGLTLSQQPLKRIAFGTWGTTNTEDLVVCLLDSAVLEIHCHGGDAAVQRVLNDLTTVGCEILDWRMQLESTNDILAAECLDVLSRTSTWSTTQIVLEQSNGLLRSAFLRLSELNRAGDETELNQSLDELLRWVTFGLHLSTPWSVVLTGRPNVGKSSLINRLLGYERAIVFDEPGTTRDVVTGETAFEGWPVVLADTAGIRRDAAQLEAAGIALARERLQVADLCIVLVDLSQPPMVDDELLITQWPSAIVVAHKSDLPDQWGDRLPAAAIRVSSVSGDGVTKLQQMLVKRLVPEVPPPETAIPLTPRQVEGLREIRRSSTRIDREKAIDRLMYGQRD
jgi:tRNA modification GTPase